MRTQDTRADGCECIEGFGVSELAAGDVGRELEVSRADVVADCVP
jgi:hypothetical protein